ncbi:MAG: anhydro-N-acetylmuramic acid kinase [Candidatus Krumholzibacteria bacterium]|nr:anhydro-N-acetylmuramic acid kinase [Candidatus Krumholzibacteria bacterium]
MTHPLAHLHNQSEFLAAGLMSGTSMDGVDAAIVGMDADPEAPCVVLRGFVTVPYPEALRDPLSDLAFGQQATAQEIAELHTAVAVAFAGAFHEACRHAGVDAARVDFIGCHGQTVAHAPPGPGAGAIAGTLQLGPPTMVAALTGVTTVGDFRSGDVALGGQGAPLSPLPDFLLRRSREHSRAILNIGGIANATILPRDCRREDVVAFDTGPGNMVLDGLYRALYPGKGAHDPGGESAARGNPSPELLEELLAHPYFSAPPPKSAGHREFGPPFAWGLRSRAQALGLSRDDTLATAAALTVESAARALAAARPEELFVTGGGAHNAAILSGLARALEAADVRPIDALGIPGDAKEAVDFALLARETVLGRPNVLPRVTGAARALVLGAIALGGPR